MWKRLTAMLAVLLLIAGCCTAEEKPVYAGTERFVQALEGAGIEYDLQGVDDDGDECVLILSGDTEIYCYFDAECESVTFLVWYLAEYEEARLAEMLLACSRLNASSGGVCFTADGSDCTVTASMDVLLRQATAGEVALDAFRHMAAILPEAQQALKAALTPIVYATPVPVPAETAEPVQIWPAATPRPVATVPPSTIQNVVITADSARIRSGPSAASGYVMTAKQGDSFRCLGTSGDWYIIDCGGRTGFVSMSVAEAR
ncbi:MAG: hypothetical protein IJ343_07955 [Clostridia bacterium]|nr:hypothetical protein [Clostridia bacterium]